MPPRKRRRRGATPPSETPDTPESDPDAGDLSLDPESIPIPVPPGRVKDAAWRMFPFRGRFLSPETRYIHERLPAPPTPFSASDVAMLCVEAEQTLSLDLPCNPAEVIDLLVSRSLVRWTAEGFVKRQRPRPRPRA